MSNTRLRVSARTAVETRWELTRTNAPASAPAHPPTLSRVAPDATEHANAQREHIIDDNYREGGGTLRALHPWSGIPSAGRRRPTEHTMFAVFTDIAAEDVNIWFGGFPYDATDPS